MRSSTSTPLATWTGVASRKPTLGATPAETISRSQSRAEPVVRWTRSGAPALGAARGGLGAMRSRKARKEARDPRSGRGQVAAEGIDAVDPGLGDDPDALGLHPVPDHVAGLGGHHARDHAVAHLHDRQLHAAGRQGLHDDAADEAGPELHHPAAGPGVLGDGAGVLQGPAGQHLGQVDPGDGRANGMRAGGHQEPVVGLLGAVGEQDAALVRVQSHSTSSALRDAQLGVMVRVLAQIGPGLVDVPSRR